LEFTQLDIVPLGFLPHTDTRFHSPSRIAHEIHDIIFENFNDLDSAVRERFEADFDYFDEGHTLVPPSMIIPPANLNSGDEQFRAFKIQVEHKDVHFCDH
jgi:hypothetical protein